MSGGFSTLVPAFTLKVCYLRLLRSAGYLAAVTMASIWNTAPCFLFSSDKSRIDASCNICCRFYTSHLSPVICHYFSYLTSFVVILSAKLLPLSSLSSNAPNHSLVRFPVCPPLTPCRQISRDTPVQVLLAVTREAFQLLRSHLGP